MAGRPSAALIKLRDEARRLLEAAGYGDSLSDQERGYIEDDTESALVIDGADVSDAERAVSMAARKILGFSLRSGTKPLCFVPTPEERAWINSNGGLAAIRLALAEAVKKK